MINAGDKLRSLSVDELVKLASGKKKQNQIERLDRTRNVFHQSYAQASQWFMQQMEPDCIYNVPQSFRIRGKVDTARLERALNAIVERHEIMRTVFTTVDGVPSQVISPYKPFKLDVIDLSAYPAEEREERIRSENTSQLRVRFDLTSGPLWKFILLKLSDEEVVLSFALHHIISDGWSFGVILNELTELYARDGEGRGPLEPLPVQYADYSQWQRKQMSSEKMAAQRNYWTRRLADIKGEINLPFDAPRAGIRKHRGDNVYFGIPEEDCALLNGACVKYHMTAYHFLISVFFLLLRAYSGERDICVGTPVANRGRVELEKLIGLFINTVAIRSEVSEEQAFSDFLQDMKEICVEAFANGEIPFEKVVESLNIQRNSNSSPIFQVLYVQMEAPVQERKAGPKDLEVSQVPVALGSSQFDLSLYMTLDKEEINAALEYDTDLFSRETAEQMAADFKKLLHRALKEPGETIGGCISEIGRRRCRVAVCSTFTAETLRESLDFWTKRLALPCDIEFAPYSQVFQQLVFAESLLKSNTGGFNVMLVRPEDWVQGVSAGFDQIRRLLCRNTDEFIRRVKTAGISNLLIYLCPKSPAARENSALTLLINVLEHKIKDECRQFSVFTAAKIAGAYRLSDYCDEDGDREWHIPYKREFFAVLGADIMSRIFRNSIHGAGNIYLLDTAPQTPGGREDNLRLPGSLTEMLEDEDEIVEVRGGNETAADAVDRVAEKYKADRDRVVVITADEALSRSDGFKAVVAGAAGDKFNAGFLP